MKIEEICEYLNELGILDIKHTPIFLSLYSGFKANNNNFKQNIQSEDNTIKIIVFAFLKKMISNDKELYEICSNIVNSYNKNKIIKLYQGICFLNKVIFYQIKSRLNNFLFLLFKKKYPKRKYFPYNPTYAANANQRSFNNTNQGARYNINNLNNIDEYSLSYISTKNKNYNNNNNLLMNTREKAYTQPDNNEYNEYQLSQINKSRRNISSKKKKFIDVTEEINKKKKEISLNNMKRKYMMLKLE